MIKINGITKIILIASCFTITTALAESSEKEKDMIASNCKSYLTEYKSLEDMPANVAKAAAPALKACYDNYSCDNPVLSHVSNCEDNLDDWHSQYSLPKIEPVVIPGAKTAPVIQKKAAPHQEIQHTQENENATPYTSEPQQNNQSNEETQQPKKQQEPSINW